LPIGPLDKYTGKRRTLKPRSLELAALGEAAESYRLRLGITQEEVAKRMEADATQAGGIERGVRNPSFNTLLRLAAALETTVGELTTLAEAIAAERRREGPGVFPR
jgi:transcriptional regulator with XRE-family HTH domain